MPGRIYDAHFNADGSRFVVGSSLDGTGEVRVYETDSGKLLSKLEGQHGPVYAVSFSTSGKVVASAGFDGLVRLNDADTGKLIKEFFAGAGSRQKVARARNEGCDFDAAPIGNVSIQRCATGKCHETDFLTIGSWVFVALAFRSVGGSRPSGRGRSRKSCPRAAKVVSLEARPAQIALTNIDTPTRRWCSPAAWRAASGSTSRGWPSRPCRAIWSRSRRPAWCVPRPTAKGKSRFQLGGQSVAVPLKISGQKADYKASFVRDVMPAMSKMGCNAGTCHGSLNGKNGFKLSLRGYDPLFDHRALTDDIAGRRINRARPGPEPDAAQAGGRDSARGRRGDPAGRALLRADPLLDRRRREARSRQPARRQDRDLPQESDRADAGHEPADEGLGHVHRRHGARRDAGGVHRQRQHRSGRAEQAGPGLGDSPRRSAGAGPFRGFVHRHHDHRDGRPQRVRVEGRAGQQLCRRAGLQQAEARQDRCRASCAPTPSSSAACRSI